jgi:uncharacterized protein (DUF983 family)
MKRCPRCLEEKEFSQFNKNRTKPDGYAIWCKSCGKRHRKPRSKEPA